MKLYNFGLDYLQKHAPVYDMRDDDVGIVTATDSNTFIGVKTLYMSVKDKINFLCYDIGLLPEQVNWCIDNKLKLVKFDINVPLIDKWQTYIKPFIVQDSPYNYTIWIDSDCIVSGNLSESKLIQTRQTFFTRHWISLKHLRGNNAMLYETYPVEGKSDPINAGVFAINKDKDGDILEEWIFMVNNTLKDEAIRSYVVNWDEGSLLWAIRKTNKGTSVIDDCRYNLYSEFAVDKAYDNIESLCDRPIQQIEENVIPSRFFKRVLESNAFVCHFSTCMLNNKKYWHRWN